MERTKKIAVVELLESQGFYTKIHQLLVYFCSLTRKSLKISKQLSKNKNILHYHLQSILELSDNMQL